MTLRTRLVFGYALLVLLLVLTGGAGAYGFREIADIVGERLEYYTATTKTSQSLVASLEQQDNATLRALLEPADPAHYEAVRVAGETFRVTLDRLDTSVDGEQARLLDRVRTALEPYEAARAATLEASSDARLGLYRETVAPRLTVVRAATSDLYATSRTHMFEARDAVRDAARSGAVLLGILVTTGLLFLIGLARSMRSHVVERLDELRRFTEAIAEGDLSQRAALDGGDELAQVAMQMNEMLDRSTAMESRLAGRLVQDRELLVAIVSTRSSGSIVLGPTGELITWAGEMPPAEMLDGLALLLSARNRERIASGADPDTTPFPWTAPDGRVLSVRLLKTGCRAVGWIAEPPVFPDFA